MRMAAFPGDLDVHFITQARVKTDCRRASTDLRQGAFLQ
jgi:hypothetical protein